MGILAREARDIWRGLRARRAIVRDVRASGGRVRYLGLAHEGYPEVTFDRGEHTWNLRARDWVALRDGVARALGG